MSESSSSETFNSPSITSFEGAAFEVAVLDGAAACADVGAVLAGAGATFSGGSISSPQLFADRAE